MLDKYLVLDDATEVISASAASGSYVDTLAVGNAVAPGARMKIQIDTAYAVSSGSPTLAFAIQTDSSATFNTSLVTLVTTSGLAYGSMTAGTVVLDVQIPMGVKRYLRCYYTLGGSGAFSAGKVDARIVLDTARTMDKSL